MGKTLVIGAAGLIGAEVVKALGAENCIRASRNSDEKVDISDPNSLAALFARMGELDGIVCTAGAARFKPWDRTTDEDWTFSLANKLLGQVNVVRYGAKSVRPGGAITLTTGLAAQFPSPGSAIISTVNSAVEAFARAAAVEPSIVVRVNAVSPGWVAETLESMGRDPVGGIPAVDVARITVRQLREGASGSVAPAAKRWRRRQHIRHGRRRPVTPSPASRPRQRRQSSGRRTG
jgi:NAD(P)-dependent dehydrogenase (short-subunit alcohol dehydrogenase family)